MQYILDGSANIHKHTNWRYDGITGLYNDDNDNSQWSYQVTGPRLICHSAESLLFMNIIAWVSRVNIR